MSYICLILYNSKYNCTSIELNLSFVLGVLKHNSTKTDFSIQGQESGQSPQRTPGK